MPLSNASAERLRLCYASESWLALVLVVTQLAAHHLLTTANAINILIQILISVYSIHSIHSILDSLRSIRCVRCVASV